VPAVVVVAIIIIIIIIIIITIIIVVVVVVAVIIIIIIIIIIYRTPTKTLKKCFSQPNSVFRDQHDSKNSCEQMKLAIKVSLY